MDSLFTKSNNFRMGIASALYYGAASTSYRKA